MNKTVTQVVLSVELITSTSPAFAIATLRSSLLLETHENSAFASENPAYSYKVASFGRFIRAATGTIKNVVDVKRKSNDADAKQKQQKQRLEVQEACEAEGARRQQQIAEACAATTAKEREEAERLRKSFDQMFPEEQAAYATEVQERKNQETALNLVWKGLAAEFIVNGFGSGSGDSNSTGGSQVYRPTQTSSPVSRL